MTKIVDFIQEKTLSSDPSLWTWPEKTKKDIDIVSVNYVLLGPLQPNQTSGKVCFIFMMWRPQDYSETLASIDDGVQWF